MHHSDTSGSIARAAGGGAEVFPFPAELREHGLHLGLRRRVVAAHEHRRLEVAREQRLDHQPVADARERLHELRLGHVRLESLHQRLVRPREQLQHAVDGRCVGDRVRRVDDRLAIERTVAARIEHLLRAEALHREHEQLAEARRIRERAGVRRRALALPPLLELLGIARAAHHVVTVLHEALGQHLADGAGSEHSDLRVRHLFLREKVSH
jgi:hypothetical protein